MRQHILLFLFLIVCIACATRPERYEPSFDIVENTDSSKVFEALLPRIQPDGTLTTREQVDTYIAEMVKKTNLCPDQYELEIGWDAEIICLDDCPPLPKDIRAVVIIGNCK